MRYENFKAVLIVGEIINLMILYKFSPVEHPNKPIAESEIIRHKKQGRLFNIIISSVAVGNVLVGINQYACVILMAQLSVSVAVILQKIKNCKRGEVKGDE